jgi:molybdopterin biosynthesis enzyme MoaB
MAIDTTRTFTPIAIALATVSDTRKPETDTSGDILAQRIADKGHTLAARAIILDEVPALVQSRAMAITVAGKYIFALPGSNGAVKDGWDGILHEQLDSRNRPCNFVELMPRLKEV